MNKITCDMCMDLIPLVKDGVASEDSKLAVEQHLACCESCRALFHEELPPQADTKHALSKFHRQLQLSSALLLMFGIFFGLSLTAGSDLFYNTIIMPVIGAIGYLLFQKKAFYQIPLLLFSTHFFINLLAILRGLDHLDFYSFLMWTILYSIFAILGTLIAGFLHFAFRKED